MTEKTDGRSRQPETASKRRMKRWLLSPELRERMQRAKDVGRPTKTGPYIAISRQAYAGGASIARIAGHQLDWDVLDREILDFMTERYGLARDMLSFVDETRANWFHDVLGSFIDARVVSHDSFVVHLERIIYLAALHGNVIFVGRGAQFVLPRTNGLAVRIVAPKKRRIEELMRRQELSRSKAAAIIDETDENRRRFCRRHFHHDVDDPLEHDLVINSDRLSPEACAELIVEAFCHARREGVLA